MKKNEKTGDELQQIQVMNDLANQNMILNQKASQDQGGFDASKLKARIMEEKLKKGPQNNADFNKKRKEHYKNEFHIAKNSGLKADANGLNNKLIEESKDNEVDGGQN